MKCLSLFSGIGGFDLALRNLGHEIIGACEIKDESRQVYARHFGNTRIYRDVKDINEKELPDFDILCAGFPCQPFSAAGLGKGLQDTRGTLFFDIARISAEKKPQYLFLENVEGLLTNDNSRTFTKILIALHEIGYDAEWQIINSKYFVPHNRPRVFIIGHLRGKPIRKIFPIREDDKILADTKESTSVRCLTGGGHSGGLHSQMTILYDLKSDTQAKRVYNPKGISPTLGTGHAMQTPNITVPVLTPDRLKKRQNGRRFKENGDPAFTLTTQDKHGIFDGKKIRRLTPMECERLQGFPDGWTEGISDTQRFKCIGNAVTVPVVQYIARHLT